jgi:hypothetical protein
MERFFIPVHPEKGSDCEEEGLFSHLLIPGILNDQIEKLSSLPIFFQPEKAHSPMKVKVVHPALPSITVRVGM